MLLTWCWPVSAAKGRIAAWVGLPGAMPADEQELRFFELLRDRRPIERLIGAAIERGARSRFMTL